MFILGKKASYPLFPIVRYKVGMRGKGGTL